MLEGYSRIKKIMDSPEMKNMPPEAKNVLKAFVSFLISDKDTHAKALTNFLHVAKTAKDMTNGKKT